MSEWLVYTWIVVGVVFIIVLLFIVPILIEIAKIIRSYRRISERIELITDVKEWYKLIKIFKK